MDFDTYQRQMTEADPLIGHMFDRGDGTCLIVKRLMFHYTLLLGTIGDMEGYDDRWCYRDEAGALHAVVMWAKQNFEGEPQGWHRHHKTGRRRTNGDPATEYINH